MSSKREDCWYKHVCQSDKPCSSCIRYLEMKFLMDNSGIPKNRQMPIKLVPDECDYDAFSELNRIKGDIDVFVEQGRNLYITGKTPGTGKTSWAIKLLLKYFDLIWAGNGLKTRGMMVHVPTLLIQLKDFQNPLKTSYKTDLLNADVVVWDEIGGTGMSQYDYSQLLMLIDQRIFMGKSNIFTGNLDNPRELEKCLGSRLASRVWGTSTVITFKGKDKRR